MECDAYEAYVGVSPDGSPKKPPPGYQGEYEKRNEKNKLKAIQEAGDRADEDLDGSELDENKTPWDVILNFLTSEAIEMTAKVKQLFTLSDKDNDGGVDIAELMQGLKEIGLVLTEAQAKAFHEDVSLGLRMLFVVTAAMTP